MKILVCISKTPDTTAKIAFTDNNTKFAETNVQYIVNPYDEWYALVRAVELKEEGIAEAITLIAVGGSDMESIIRKALAIGGDNAIRVNAISNDSFFVASQIAAIAAKGGYDLILTGRETIDYNGGMVAGMVAGLLGYSFIALANKINVTGNIATIESEIDGGSQSCQVALPVVISCQKGVAEQRIASMKGIMGARTKPLTVVESVAATELTATVNFELPEAKKGVKLIAADNVSELVQLLHEEAKVI